MAWRVRKFFMAHKFMIGNKENSTNPWLKRPPLTKKAEKMREKLNYLTAEQQTQATQPHQDSCSRSIFFGNSRTNLPTKGTKQSQSLLHTPMASAASIHDLPAASPMPKLASMDMPPAMVQRMEDMSWQHGQSQ
jgi:hypothetical protein